MAGRCDRFKPFYVLAGHVRSLQVATKRATNLTFGPGLGHVGRGVSRRVVSHSLTITHTQRDREVAVSAAPFIVKTVSRIHPGKAEAYRPVVAEFCRLVEESEPRLLAFHIYVSEDEGSEVVIQVHPDAESMRHHLEVMGQKVRETFAFTDFESLEIYGEPDNELKEWIAGVSEGIPFTIHSVHWGGFTRA
jgi:quinol monooxygenase YgiN